jgi:hypothetical protein
MPVARTVGCPKVDDDRDARLGSGRIHSGVFRVFSNPCRGTVPALLVDDKAILTDQDRKFARLVLDERERLRHGLLVRDVRQNSHQLRRRR